MTNGRSGFSIGEMLRDLEAVRREVDRAFEEASPSGWLRPFSRSSFLPGWRARSCPLLNVSEDGDSVYVEALAPGLDPDT
jgi:HSP20 family protein